MAEETPNISPPPSPPDMEGVVSVAMRKEEQELLKEREKRDELHQQELERKRQEDVHGGADLMAKKQDGLDLLLGQSQVGPFKLNSTCRNC
jgi:hypothetical protein